MAHLQAAYPAPHPIRSMLAAFPLALLPAALATDIAYARSAQMEWADFSVWLIAGGAAFGVLVVLADLVAAARHRRRASPLHGVLLVAAVVTAIFNGFIHSRDAWTSVVPTGLVLSVVTTILILAASWPSRSGAVA